MNTGYDPLIHTGPGQAQRHPHSYWADTLTEQPTTAKPLQQALDVDVAIIGAGYTGMTTALYLAREQGIKAIVLEANRVAFGASGRNAGFVLPSTGRLGAGAMADRWGQDIARRILAEYRQSVDAVKQLIADYQIDCQPQRAGYLKVAHNSHQFKLQQQLSRRLQAEFDYGVELLSREQLASQVDSPLAHGALLFPDGFGVHPLKLALGYQQALIREGIPLYEGTPVSEWRESNGRHQLVTPGGTVTADKVVCAGNAYTPKQFHPLIDHRTMPVQSSIVVTQPYSDQELSRAGLHTEQVIMDTRALKYYFRRLPDNRILFGGRGAISGRNSEHPVFKERLLSALQQNFPQLPKPNADYAWSGWINVSLDDIPHIHEEHGVYYATGYCGSGVAFSAQAGRRLAQRIAGQAIDTELPHYGTPLPKFPLPQFRRIGQWGYYQYGRLKDQFF